MNKRKAISYILTTILLLGGILAGKSYAALSGKVVLSAPAKVTKEDTLTVYVKTSNVQTGKGIVAMGAVLDYDKNSLTLKEVEGEGRWGSPSYNQGNGKLTSLRSKRMTSDENILKITFAVNKNAQTSTWVKISNLEISDGEEEKVIGGNTVTISVQDKEEEKPPVDEDKNQGETPEGGNQGGDSGSGTTTKPNTTTDKKPSTTKPSTTKKPTNNSDKTQTTTTEEPEQPETEETNTVVNEVEENTTENTAAGIQEEMANLMQSTKPTVEENKKDNKWLLLVVLGIVIVLVIAIVGYERRK